jgi:hypothetical protein
MDKNAQEENRMGKLLNEMNIVELADQRLEKMGFDQYGKDVIISHTYYKWILTATEKEINDWYDDFTK